MKNDFFSEKSIQYFVLDMINGFTSEISELVNFLATVGDSVNSTLPDLPFLSVLPSLLVIWAENHDGSWVAFNVVEVFKKINACLVISLPAFESNHVWDHSKFDVHPIQKPSKLSSPFLGNSCACQLQNFSVSFEHDLNIFIIVLGLVIHPDDQVVFESDWGWDLRKPKFIKILLSFNLLNEEVSERQEKNLFLALIQRVWSNILSSQAIYVKNSPRCSFKAWSDWGFFTWWCKVFKVDHVSSIMKVRKADSRNSSMN